MSGRDRTFAFGALGASLLVPGLLLLAKPLGETREVMGILVGWGLALATIVPSYALLSHALRANRPNTFLRQWMTGMLGRSVVIVVAVFLFATLVENPPLMSFLLSLFLGYGILTALELTLALGNASDRSPDGRHA